MAIEKINIQQFAGLSSVHPVLDVRSPGEFLHAHIPGAYSLPLFTDEERKVVGTAYKQQSRQAAIKIGLDYFGVKMRSMVEEVEKIFQTRILPPTMSSKKAHTILVHCWRGGMRSAGVAWLLDLYGFKVYTLAGGYKMYRSWVRGQFEKEHRFNIIGGYTGSGKTLLINEIKKRGNPVIDLEGLASHKGSAFGALGENAQPSQEMFENLLAQQLFDFIGKQAQGAVIYMEDESQRIGLINIPPPLWRQMRISPVRFFDVPFEERLNYLTVTYGKFEKEKLVNAIMRIQKRLGGLETKNAIGYLLENNVKECFRILLQYYDKWYSKGLGNRQDLSALLTKIPCTTIDVNYMTNMILHEKATAE